MNEFSKFVCLAKVFAMANHRNRWTEEQREYYKTMVDFGNEVTKQH